MRAEALKQAGGPPRPGADKDRDATVLARLAALKEMTVNEMKAEWRRLFGADAPNNSRPFLEMRLAWRIQELSYGGPSRETVRLLDALADELHGKPGRKALIADPRKPVAGTRLVREWDGVEHTVTVLRDGFEFEGRKYKSLSAIARAITGTRWNGWRFFGLREIGRDKP
ncbi:putative bacteriophage-related protein [Rhodospirillum centenum SW]|uniref:Bacteriophage-related protein n=2 Tax=Rhodospirillum centenum TaxID=34018 RepID=B6IPV1_RHOCS|nr:putative bacteriophage-related protein [Rhodospirillum centenum SW]